MQDPPALFLALRPVSERVRLHDFALQNLPLREQSASTPLVSAKFGERVVERHSSKNTENRLKFDHVLKSSQKNLN